MSNLIPSHQEMKEITEVCKILAQSPFYQKIGPGGVLAIWLTARELNLPVMHCLNGGLYTFDGKVTMSAQLMNMMIVNAGNKITIKHLDDKYCKIDFIRKDRPKDIFTFEYSIEMASKAGLLSKDSWKKNARDMLFARTISGGAKKYFPDILGTIYGAGEITDPNCLDDDLVSCVPPIYDNVIENKPEVLQIDISEKEIDKFINSQEYISFCEKHHLILIENIPDTHQRKYLKEMCKKANYTQEDMIKAFMKNEKLFEEKFSKWLSELNNEEVF